MDMMDLKNVYDTVLSSGAQVLNDTNSLADSYTKNDLYTQEITLLRDRCILCKLYIVSKLCSGFFVDCPKAKKCA